MTKSKFLSGLILFIICLVGNFSVKSCSETSTMHKNQISVTYNVTGHRYEQSGRSSAKHYVFLHNDKYGDFTVNVTPKTYYDVEHGKKTLTFKDSFKSMLYNADNKHVQNNVWVYCEDFNIEKNIFTYNEPLMIGFLMVGYAICIILLFPASTMSPTNDKNFENAAFFADIIVIIGSIIWSVLVNFF